MTDRRQFLLQSAALVSATAGATLMGARPARGMGQNAEVGIALLRHGPGFDQRPKAVPQLMWEVSKRTSINVREKPRVVDPESKDLFEEPLVVWIGTGEAPPFSDAAIKQLRRFLRAGGTLFIDDASPDDAFDASVRRELARIWPDRALAPVDPDHTLFRTFFLINESVGRVRRERQFEGISFDDRSPVLYGRNDLFGAFGRDNLGGWLLPVVPGGNVQREWAFRVGVNLVMYATCINYKRDQVHTTAILRRRRWRVRSR